MKKAQGEGCFLQLAQPLLSMALSSGGQANAEIGLSENVPILSGVPLLDAGFHGISQQRHHLGQSILRSLGDLIPRRCPPAPCSPSSNAHRVLLHPFTLTSTRVALLHLYSPRARGASCRDCVLRVIGSIVSFISTYDDNTFPGSEKSYKEPNSLPGAASSLHHRGGAVHRGGGGGVHLPRIYAQRRWFTPPAPLPCSSAMGSTHALSPSLFGHSLPL